MTSPTIDFEALKAERAEAQDALEDLRIEYGHAQREARDLAVWLHKTYYAEVADWKPFDHASGLLSQIDNMVAGVRDRLAAKEAVANGVRNNIPMDYLERHPGDLVASMRDFAKDRWTLIDRITAANSRIAELVAQRDGLVEALKEARRVLVVAIEANCDIEGFNVADHLTIKEIDAALSTIKAGGGADV